MAAARAVFFLVAAISALAVGGFVGGSIAQPALMELVPWASSSPHNS